MNIADPAGWIPLAAAVRLGSIALALALVRRTGPSLRAALLGSALASVATGAAAVSVLESGGSIRGVLVAHAASGIVLGYGVDALSAWFLVVLALLAVPISIYSLGYLRHGVLEARAPFVAVAFSVLVGAVEMVFAADGVISFLFFWELMTLATTALVATEHEAAQNRRAAFLYLAMSHVATGCLLAGFLTLSAAAGSLSFASVLGGRLALPHPDVVFLLFLAGFGVKAGVIPLHVWLPEAHPAAPSSVSALMSAVMIKTGVYGMFRVCAFGLGVPSPGWAMLVLALGGASAVLGVLYALMQHDLKRLLAYHSIENIGIILLGLGAGMLALASGRAELAAIGVMASLYHVLNHAVFKGLLFLGAGGVVAATGTRLIEEMGGLARRMPWTCAFFLVGSAAISGLPLLNGFVSEWLLFQAFLFGFHVSPEPHVRFLFPVAGALLALTTALAAACFVKAFAVTFLALPRGERAAAAHESTLVMLLPQGFLAATCFALGLFPGTVVRVLQGVAGSLPGVAPSPDMVRGALATASGLASFDQLMPAGIGLSVLAAVGLAAALSLVSPYAVRRAATWGCGGVLSERTEYTATAFSKPLMMIFAAIYRPTREVHALGTAYFPERVTYRAEIEPTFERFVYGPLMRAVLSAADALRVIQAGSLHAYLGYVIALVVGLVLMVWLRG